MSFVTAPFSSSYLPPVNRTCQQQRRRKSSLRGKKGVHIESLTSTTVLCTIARALC